MSNKHPTRKITSAQAIIMGKKGGESTSIKKKISRRKWCDMNCPSYTDCWAIPYCSVDEKTHKKLCFLNQCPKELKEMTYNLFANGETGWNHEITKLLIKFVEKVKDLPDKKGRTDRNGNTIIETNIEKIKLFKDAIDTMVKSKNSFFGTKTINENKEISFIDSLRTAAKELKVIDGELVKEVKEDEKVK